MILQQENRICPTCGGSHFTKGVMKSSDANVRPIGKPFSLGSPVIFTFCKQCGEVASIKIEKPEKF
ncbi:hypothetical protein [Paenibacillus sp. 22594]|uniref:hypothetical protein n=1 Tax=Paenibacillus sp. 22594 TaxID=3453947 RepID=UPI003F87664F